VRIKWVTDLHSATLRATSTDRTSQIARPCNRMGIMERARQRSWSDILGTVGIAGLLLAFPAAAQQPQQPPASVPAQTPSKPNEKSGGDQNRKSQEQEASPKNDRIFWTLPNYLTVENAAHVPPLTTGGKFKLTAKDSFDPVEIPYIGLVAGIGQAQNSEPSYGQGGAGYGRRYGTAFADNTIGNFMTEAVFPSMLRQDPRYFQLGKGGFWRRTGYAFSRLIVTRSDSGQSQLNSSEIAGNAIGAGIASSYHPAQDRGLSNTMSIWGTQIMWDGVANEMKEFWPDIHHWFRRNKKEQQ
jgi:hypothetical protein